MHLSRIVFIRHDCRLSDFDHATLEQTIAVIGVRVSFTRIEIERQTQHASNHFMGTSRRCDAQRLGKSDRLKHGIKRFVLVPAASMLKQLSDRDLILSIIEFRAILEMRLISQNVKNRVVELQRSLFDQLQNGDRGDRLRKYWRSERDSKCVDGLLRGDYPHIRSHVNVNQPAMIRDGDAATRNVVLVHERREEIVEWRKGRGDVNAQCPALVAKAIDDTAAFDDNIELIRNGDDLLFHNSNCGTVTQR